MDPSVMFEITPDFGSYSEQDAYDENGTSFSYNITFTVAKDRLAQRQFEAKYRNVLLGAFVQNANKQWKYYQALRLRSNLQSGTQRADLNNYSYTLFGNGIERSQFALMQELALTLNTDWDEATDGTFSPSITASSTGRWVFENGLEVQGNSIAPSGTGLDGTLQEVRYIVSDFSTVESVDFANLKLVGTLDLTLLVFSDALSSMNADNNASLTDIAFSEGENVLNQFTANNTALVELDLSNVRLRNTFSAFNCSQLTSIRHSVLTGTPNRISNIYRAFNSDVATIDWNSFEIDASTFQVRLDRNSMSVAEIDAILAGIDGIALPGTASIELDGNNAAPTGGVNNPNVLSLVGKGYTVIVNP